MIAASRPREEIEEDREKLLVLAADRTEVARIHDLADYAKPEDIWILNDAATFPASLHGITQRAEPIELRLLPHREGNWSAVVFGEGTWRMKTEDRPLPPPLPVGETLFFSNGLRATVRETSPLSPRLIRIAFNQGEARLWKSIYEIGKPIQYSYLEREYGLWSFQTPFAARPWAAEMPSAGRPLRWEILRRLREKGARIAILTHATGLSSTGDPSLDAHLPLPEFYEIPENTARAIERAKRFQGRVIAVGTSVFRALEGAARKPGGFSAGSGETDFLGAADTSRRIVDGILSGIHSPGESHFELLRSFASTERLIDAGNLAQNAGFLTHEFGDSLLIT